METYRRLSLALAIGLLAGLERGWQLRSAREGGRVAGLRTFGLIGLLGGLTALLARSLGPWPVAAGLLGLAAVETRAQTLKARSRGDIGITTVVASFVTFALGALAVQGFESQAAAAAVVTVFLLRAKAALHGRLERLAEDELAATLKLLLLGVVVLPVLPRRPFGPWGSLNPYELGWMVLLIAGLSYVGYFALRLFGPRLGTGLVNLLGGILSSTAVALSLAQSDRREPGSGRLHAGGMLIASATMFPRILIEAAVVDRALAAVLAPALAAAAVAGYAAAAALLAGGEGSASTVRGPALKNPLELGAALKFGALLAGIGLAAGFLGDRLGPSGVWMSAGTAGLADVDAITLSLARMSRDGMDRGTAAGGILLAAGVNSLVKGGIVAVLAGGRMARWSAAGLALMAASAAAAWGLLG